MKRSKFTDSQIMEALKRVDAGLPVADVCRELAIRTTNFKNPIAIRNLLFGGQVFR